MSQKKLILIVVIVTIIIAGALVGVAWWHQQNSNVTNKVKENSNANSNTNKNTNISALNLNIDKAVISSKIDPQNGKNFTPNGWVKVELNSTSASSNEPHSNLNDKITQVSDSIVNPFTGERFYVQRDTGSTYCGPNGDTSICNLVREKKDGSTEIVQDLWFPEPYTRPDGQKTTVSKFGARLVKFVDAQTLRLFFSAADHGGGYLEVSDYSLSDHSLASLIEYIQPEGSDLGGYTILSYNILKGGSRLEFQNGNTSYDSVSKKPIELKMGAYLFTKTGDIKQLNFPAGPYSVTFNIMDNIEGQYSNLKVNGVETRINMNDGSFEYL